MSAGRRRGELEEIRRNAAGEYVYTGDLYVYRGSRPRVRALIGLWGLSGGAALAALIAGLLPAPGMTGCWYVPIPYVLTLAAAAGVLWSLGQITSGGDPIRSFVYETATGRLPRRQRVTAALAALTAAGEGIYLLRHGGAGPGAWALLGLMVLCGGLSLGGCRLGKTLEWEKQ